MNINHIQARLGGIYGGSLGETGDASAVNGAGKQNNAVHAAAAYGSRDGVELSSSGVLLRKATSAISDLPEVREDRVAALKSSIANGSYSVDYNQLATKLFA